MGRHFEDGLEHELHQSRPAPTDDYVASIAGSVRGSGRSSSVRRLTLAVVLSLVAFVALAATGGMTQATAAPQSLIGIVKKAFVSKPANPPKLNTVSKSSGKDQYGEKKKCNSGRGNGSEGDSSQLIDPHAGGRGPGEYPTLDCDPGNSGGKNRGGD